MGAPKKKPKIRVITQIERYESPLHVSLARRLCAHHYGAGQETIHSILTKLTEGELRTLFYNAYRTADKVGKDSLFPDTSPYDSEEEEF